MSFVVLIAFDCFKYKVFDINSLSSLFQTVSNNEILCCKLSEADIRQVFTLASTGSTPEYYEFFTTLEAVMKVVIYYIIIITSLLNYSLTSHLTMYP